MPYASLLPTGRTVAEYAESLVDKAVTAKERVYRAAKLEGCIRGPYSHNAIQGTDEEIVEIVAACRRAVGAEFTLMVDVAYCWSEASGRHRDRQ